jgi:hypothetical protein
MELSIVEKGDAAKILDWFKRHTDVEYADLLEEVVRESRKELKLR